MRDLQKFGFAAKPPAMLPGRFKRISTLDLSLVLTLRGEGQQPA
jgi:hypothetical protein